MRFPGFIGPSYQLRSVNVDCQRAVNLFAEFDELGTAKEKSVGALYGTPGLSAPLLTLPTSPYRGSFLADNGTYYVCSGNTLYFLTMSVLGIWTYTVVGTILTTNGPVSMDDNGIALMLVDGQNGWFTTLGSTVLTQVISPNFLAPATQVVYMDGRFVFNMPGTNKFFVSDQLATTFSGAFDAKATEPDFLIGMVVDHKNLWLFGQYTTEVWFDAGNAPPSVPFSLIQGGYVETGCAAQFSIQKLNNTVFFIGQDRNGRGVVYQLQGFQPVRVSTHAIETAINNMGDISGTTSWTYQEAGHNFYCLNFKNASGLSVSSTTWCYDMDSGLWHERAYLSFGQYQRSIIEGHDFVNNMHIVGDYQSGNIYQMSLDIFSDNGNPIVRERTFPHLNADMRRMFHSSLQLDLESGVGIDGTGQGVDPQVILQFSDDGGNKWSNEKWASMGKIGQKRWRAKWERLGQSRDKIYRIKISDPVKVVLIGAELGASAGAA